MEIPITKIDNSQRIAARVAGFAGLITIIIVIIGNYVLLSPLIIKGNAAATAQNIIAHETQFRIALTCFLIYSLGVIVLLAALYLVLKRVNSGLALVGALFRLTFALLWLLTALNLLGALRLLSGISYLQVFETDRLQALARLSMAANFDDYYVGLPFFGLAATVCSYLWFKSGYIPRLFALFGLISSAWCVLCAFLFLIFPSFGKTVDPYWFDSPMALFEMALSFWLLFKGVNANLLAGPPLASSSG
jgi:hypothetical protein